MNLSVIIPAYCAESTIEACIKAVRASNYKDYELIVVDDGSPDQTRAIAQRYADQVLEHPKNLGRTYARNSGIQVAKGDILLLIDSDIVIKSDTLGKVVYYFSNHEEIDALTGLLSKEHPYQDYFSRYKNYYMNFIFRQLPERVNFLYGSIFAIRRRSLTEYDHDIAIADDTALGQKLTQEGKKIAFMKDLEVIHLKKHDFLSWIKNDFQIPFDWAQIFIKYKGWKTIGENKTGYLHSPKEQLVSVAIVPWIALFMLGAFWGFPFFIPATALSLIWLLLNLKFIFFLMREQDFCFGLIAIPVTFLDHLVMATGIFSGFVKKIFF